MALSVQAALKGLRRRLAVDECLAEREAEDLVARRSYTAEPGPEVTMDTINTLRLELEVTAGWPDEHPISVAGRGGFDDPRHLWP